MRGPNKRGVSNRVTDQRQTSGQARAGLYSGRHGLHFNASDDARLVNFLHDSPG